MVRALVGCLLVIAGGCAVDSSTVAAPDAAVAPPEVSASVLVSWAGEDVVSASPNDSRVPRMLTGPMKPCPDVVGDPVVQIAVEVTIGTSSAYVADETFDCALGHATIPVPPGSGTFRLDVYTAAGYAWLAAYQPVTTVTGEATDVGRSNLNNEIPTSGGGGGGDDGDGGGLGGYF